MFDELRARWQKATGEPMPEAILRQPLKKICKAVLLVEAGNVVVVPREPVEVPEVQPSSMMDHDNHGEFT